MMRGKALNVLLGLLVPILLCTACAGDDADRLIGKWSASLGGNQGSIVIEFKEDGELRTTFTHSPQVVSPGEWRLLDDGGLEVSIPTGSGQAQVSQMKYAIDGIKLTLTMGEEVQVFYRLED